MRFDDHFRTNMAELDELRLSDPDVQQALLRYDDRSFVLDVESDATYVFYITSDGVRYEVNPRETPHDMYAAMDMERAEKLVFQQTLSPWDVLFHVKHRNITMDDVNFVKRLFR